MSSQRTLRSLRQKLKPRLPRRMKRPQWQKMQATRPRLQHGFTLEHFGYATPEQVTRAAELGARVSANVYYLHELSALYARESVGYERASSMARLASTVRAGSTRTRSYT